MSRYSGVGAQFHGKLGNKFSRRLLEFPASQFDGLSDGPDVDFFRDDAPIGVIIVGRDDVQVLDVPLDQLVELALAEHVVETVQRHGTARVRRQRILRRRHVRRRVRQLGQRWGGRAVDFQLVRGHRAGLVHLRRPGPDQDSPRLGLSGLCRAKDEFKLNEDLPIRVLMIVLLKLSNLCLFDQAFYFLLFNELTG